MTSDKSIYTPKRHPVSYASAVPGAGKTFAACQHMADDRHDRNQLYVAPSKVLIRQTSDQLETFGVPHTVITEDTVDFGTVSGAVTTHLDDSPEFGRVLLITWQTYRNLPYFHQRENWNIIIDEVPQVDTLFDAPLPFNHQYITRLAQISDPVNEQLALMEAIDPVVLNKWLKQPEDAVNDTFRNLFYDIRNPNIDVFVDVRSWNRVVENGKVNKKSPSKNRIRLLRMLRPELFEGTTVMGAGVEDSMLYTWLTRYHSVEFKRADHISDNLRFERYDFEPERVTVSYLMAERPMSKYQRDTSLLKDVFEQGVQRQFPDDPFLFFTNNDYQGALTKHDKAVRMPVKSHGLNAFQDVDNVVFFTAMNRTVGHIGMLQSLGFTSEEIRRGTGHETLFQDVMRCSLRDPASDRPAHVVVADKFEATHLVQAFGQCKVGRLGSNDYKMMKEVNSSIAQVRNNKFNDYNDLEEMSPNQILYKSICKSTSGDIGTNVISHPSTPIASYAAQAEPDYRNEIIESGKFWLTTHNSKFDSDIQIFEPHDLTIIEFVHSMRAQSKATIDNKEDVAMIVPALLVPRDTEGHRRLTNYFSSSFVVLEFDDGMFSPDDAVDCFDKSAGRGQKRSFLIHSSFNRTPETPNKFKMWFPLSEPIFEADTYRSIWDSLRQRVIDYLQDRIGDEAFEEHLSALAERSPDLKPHQRVNMLTGLDDSSRSPVQSQYLPGTNAKHPDMALFKAVKMQKQKVERHAIRPKGYAKTAQKSVERTKVVDVNKAKVQRNQSDEAIQEAKRLFWKVPVGQGLRNSEFYRYSIWIAQNCHGRADTEQHLNHMAGDDRKMLLRVPGVMKSLGDKARQFGLWEYSERVAA